MQILGGRGLEEVRNNTNSGETSKRKKKDLSVKKSYRSDSVLGHIGHKSIESIMEIFKTSDEPQNNHKDREHGKGSMSRGT